MTHLMTFGRYRHQPARRVLEDVEYWRWLRDQDWLPKDYPDDAAELILIDPTRTQPTVFWWKGRVWLDSRHFSRITGKAHSGMLKAVNRVVRDFPETARHFRVRGKSEDKRVAGWVHMTREGFELVMARLQNEPGRVDVHYWHVRFQDAFIAEHARRTGTAQAELPLETPPPQPPRPIRSRRPSSPPTASTTDFGTLLNGVWSDVLYGG